ncbi:hypothetical protein Xmau_03811 [Xenorhabdus mauleonii]|uniref:Uncharacterized protein n=1 Tax=Xenorhabdus mauleonii TaxID=351675 RepID=A0A1I3V1V1_9GAMM|nr:hypothetical protein [Xenorhabdus mauleonii]PHM37594.1 hypothetical protein Xmau_03811 [Xenorhabdus mauleonii]SFJ89215.1 hypothetical protein SAMN05421680_11916 [Xenorhabdus mauleonii]
MNNHETYSTIVVPIRIIGDISLRLAEIAIKEGEKASCYDALDIRKYTFFINGTLSLELFFKSFSAKRKHHPSHFNIIKNENLSQISEDEYNNTNIPAISFLHSKIEIPKKLQSHDLEKLFLSIPEKHRKEFLKHVYEKSRKIKNEEHFMKYISSIKNYFIKKRYPFEHFQLGSPEDSSKINDLISILKGLIAFIKENPDNRTN